MSTKELPLEMREMTARLLAATIKQRFPEGTSQEVIAEAIGIKQPVLSRILGCKGSLGANALIAIRNFTGHSIDELLGLPPLPRPQSADELRALLEQVLSTLPKAKR